MALVILEQRPNLLFSARDYVISWEMSDYSDTEVESDIR